MPRALRTSHAGRAPALIGAVIFWIVAFDHPLWGARRIPPEPFERTLDALEAVSPAPGAGR